MNILNIMMNALIIVILSSWVKDGSDLKEISKVIIKMELDRYIYLMMRNLLVNSKMILYMAKENFMQKLIIIVKTNKCKLYKGNGSLIN